MQHRRPSRDALDGLSRRADTHILNQTRPARGSPQDEGDDLLAIGRAGRARRGRGAAAFGSPLAPTLRASTASASSTLPIDRLRSERALVMPAGQGLEKVGLSGVAGRARCAEIRIRRAAQSQRRAVCEMKSHNQGMA